MIVDGKVTMSESQSINESIAESGPVRDRGDESTHGLVMVIGGIGGLDWCGFALRRLLKNRRSPYTIQVFPWGLGFGRWHADLTNTINRDTQARLIAETIRLQKASQSGCPVFVVAKSGGAGVAVKALELLDEEAVERVVLLAPAVSPTYDLTGALRAIRREMVVYWSPFDLLILGAGTRLFGTIDRVKDLHQALSWLAFGFHPLMASTRLKPASTESSVRFAGTLEWPPAAISAVIWGRILLFS